MFEFLKKEKAAHKQISDFMKQEQKRREEAERFIAFAISALVYVAEDLWGGEKASISVGKYVSFDVKEQAFFLEQKAAELDDIAETRRGEVLIQKGRPFWEAMKEIMEYTRNLLDDIQKKETGRNLLVEQMQVLNQRIEKSPTFSMAHAMRNMSL